jgi:hypothetical protein
LPSKPQTSGAKPRQPTYVSALQEDCGSSGSGPTTYCPQRSERSEYQTSLRAPYPAMMLSKSLDSRKIPLKEAGRYHHTTHLSNGLGDLEFPEFYNRSGENPASSGPEQKSSVVDSGRDHRQHRSMNGDPDDARLSTENRKADIIPTSHGKTKLAVPVNNASNSKKESNGDIGPHVPGISIQGASEASGFRSLPRPSERPSSRSRSKSDSQPRLQSKIAGKSPTRIQGREILVKGAEASFPESADGRALPIPSSRWPHR